MGFLAEAGAVQIFCVKPCKMFLVLVQTSVIDIQLLIPFGFNVLHTDLCGDGCISRIFFLCVCTLVTKNFRN